MKNGNGNGNGLARRLEKLEIGFNLLIQMLAQKSARLLYSSHTPSFNRLIAQYEAGTISAKSMLRLCQWLRRVEGDREQAKDVRMASGCLLIAIELRHSVQGR